MTSSRDEALRAEWKRWRVRLHGDQVEDDETRVGELKEDLSSVLIRVRPGKLESTRKEWSTEWRTITFCDLGLHLLYRHHVGRSDSESLGEDTKLFRNLGPEALQKHASVVLHNQSAVKQLNRDRWTSTWSHQGPYLDDLIAYLFRPGPHQRRLDEVQPHLIEMAKTTPLGQFIRQGADAELRSVLDDPLAGLIAFVQSALPGHPAIRTYVRRLDETLLTNWAKLYAQLFPMYGMELRSGVQWRDVAELFTTTAEGAQIRVRAREGIPRLTTGDDIFAASILAMLPGLFTIEPGEIAGRTVTDRTGPFG